MAQPPIPEPIRAAAVSVLHSIGTAAHRPPLTAPPATAVEPTALAGLLAQQTLRNTPRDVLICDPILEELIDEMLLHPHISQRVMAQQLLRATPYRRPLADAIRSQIPHTALTTTSATATLISALGILGDHTHRPILHTLALTNQSPTIAEAAIRALAHLPGTSPQTFWHHMTSHPHPATIAAVTYAAGVARLRPSLTNIHNNQSLPPTIRASASWWLTLPAHILNSTGTPPTLTP